MSSLAIYLLPIVVVCNLALASVIMLRGLKSTINRSFVAMSLGVVIWSVAIMGFYLFPSADISRRFWIVLSHSSAAFIALIFFYFTVSFRENLKIAISRRRIFTLATLPFFAINYFLFTSTSIIGNVNGNAYEIGPAYLVYSLYVGFYFILGYAALYRQYQLHDGQVERRQIKYILTGYLLSSALAMVTDLILPYAHNFSFTWLGPLFTFIMLAAVAYTILKHNLFDVKVVTTELITFAIWMVMLVQVTLAKTWVERITNITVLVLLILFGSFLIRSVLKEVSQRVELQKLTGQLRQTNAELLVRNRYLAALQSITSEITRSLDFKKVTQEIVDGVASKLGFVGGLLILVAPDGKTTEVAAVTQSQLMKKVIKFLPNSLTSYKGDFLHDQTLAALAMRTGRLQIGSDLDAFISPVVPKGLAKIIQMAARIRTVLAVPIYAENKVLGCLLVAMRLPKEEVAQTEFQMIQSLADEVGIVTRNISLYEQLEKANTQLISANAELARLDKAKTEFLSIASHQLRTPLTAIKGYMSMVMEGDYGRLPTKMFEPLKDVFDSTQRLINLVNDLLDVSRIASGRLDLHIEPVDLTGLTLNVIEEIKPKAEAKNIEVVTENKLPESVKVKADSEKLRQVVMNLIDNAIKYTDKGVVKVSFEVIDKFVRFAVRDNGIGISAEELPQLFHRFIRTKEAQLVQTEGTGLGLYVAKTIIEAQGGKVWAESEGIGKGSTFLFEIPIAEGEVVPETIKVVPRERYAA